MDTAKVQNLTKLEESVNTEAITAFLQDSESEVLSCFKETASPKSIRIKKEFFDFSNLNQSARKTILNLQDDKCHFSFENCIIIGEIRFEHCQMEYLTFKNCQFVEPENWHGRRPSSPRSLSMTDTTMKNLSITKCVLANAIEVHSYGPSSISLQSVIAPMAWLIGMLPYDDAGFNVQNFTGGQIHLPDGEKVFKSVCSCDWSLRHFAKTHQRITVNMHH